MKGKDILQKWQIDLEDYFDVYSSFIIDGYIDDLHPYTDQLDLEANANNVFEVSLTEYFEKLMVNKDYHDKRNLLVIYDPTEAISKRFDIKSEFVNESTTEQAAPNNPNDPTAANNNENEPAYPNGHYPNSRLADHFYDILKSEDVDKMLVDHSYYGPSPDFAKIHYAITEESRLNPFERVFINFFDEFVNIISSNPDQETNYVFVVKMLSRLKTSEDSKSLSAEELGLFRQLLLITEAISETSHKLIILTDKVSDIPAWLGDETKNFNIKHLHIDRPNDSYKEFYFDRLITNEKFGPTFINQYNEQCVVNANDNEEDRLFKVDARKRILRKFLAYSNDFSMRQLRYYDAYLDDETHEVKDLDKLGFSLANFRAGELKNPWENEETVQNILNIIDRLKRKLKGQDHALEQVQEILRRSTIGLDRIDNPDAPRVILFLAGPTGTGKTEICKQLAEIIFGSADRIVRFDMSEYGNDASDQKLFGAPPGYIGYQEGGKLTNAILKEPFSLVLFDEIEKAHPSILDKFLQILSDGRLTSGKGETVYFSDSIIVITSNAGVTSSKIDGLDEAAELEKMERKRPTESVTMKDVAKWESEGKDPEEIYEKVSDYLSYFVKFYFVCNLNRPELYGRIEDSIVYYNYIGKDAVKAICKAKVKSFFKAANDLYQLNFDLDIINTENDVFNELIKQCQTVSVRSRGARGIGKEMNKIFNGSLSNYISEFVIQGRKNELVGKTLRCRLRDGFEIDENVDLTKPGKLKTEDIIWEII